MRVVSYSDFLAGEGAFDAVIDARSPSEYLDDHLPGAISLPVLTDAQRAEVGTIYKQRSPFEARRVGAYHVCANVADHLSGPLADMPRDWRPLVYCWRGGQRSASMTHVLSEVGWRAVQLEGGYRAHRRWVLDHMDLLVSRHSYRIIAGPTGTAKSRLLGVLKNSGQKVLDIEAIGRHRGSLLGEAPTGEGQPSQKAFETELWNTLRSLPETPGPVYVESESRTLGRLRVPDALWSVMRAAPCYALSVPLSARVEYLMNDYRHWIAHPEGLKTKLRFLRALHGSTTIASWEALIDQGDWHGLVQALLTSHYDPAYFRSINKDFVRSDSAKPISLASLSDEALIDAARAIATDEDR